jgi:flagellar biosynthesis chaperone FliJ
VIEGDESTFPEPPVDLMLRPAFELPRNRRKRLAAWEKWKKDNWQTEPSGSGRRPGETALTRGGVHEGAASTRDPGTSLEETGLRRAPGRDRPRSDRDYAELLRRSEEAVGAILASDAHTQNLVDPPVDVELLRENVQAISEVLQQITDLRGQQRSIAADMSDPMTAAVLESQQQVLAMALQSVTSRVEKLENYASVVKQVDETYRDWIGVQQAERLNESFRDMLAETVRDELAVEELKRLTETTTAAEQAFRHSIQEANLAAEAFAPPDQKKS